MAKATLQSIQLTLDNLSKKVDELPNKKETEDIVHEQLTNYFDGLVQPGLKSHDQEITDLRRRVERLEQKLLQ